MSKRAEEAALKAYPFSEGKVVATGLSCSISFDQHHDEREAFIKGYEQAEKDLALAIEDMERIHTFLYAIKNNKSGQFTFTRLSDKQHEEALRRFNEWRERNETDSD